MHSALRLIFPLCTIAGAVQAQTITVTTSMDIVDVGAAATIADLPGPDGVVSLREALRASDNTPGHQIVGFEIPEEDWYLPDIFPGLVLLQGSLSWHATEPVTIDGTTQTAFTGDTNPDGNEVVIYGLSLFLNGDSSVARGLHGSRVELGGSGGLVEGNTGDMYIVLYSGSGGLVRNNEADTISLSYSSHNVIVGNTTTRVRVSGAILAGLPAANNRIGGPDPADRNFITGWGNYGEHGVPSGTTVELYDTIDSVIENNYIGTTPDGMAIGNSASRVGVGILGDNRNLTIRDNLIAIRAIGVGPANGALYGQPIYVDSLEGGVGIDIVGNTMGLNAAGEPVLGGLKGVWVSANTLEYTVGLRILDNVIAGHSSTGVLLENGPGIVPASGVRLSRNSIYANGEIGIDLTPNTWTFGPTANDPLDADAGANDLQNYPVLTAATREGAGVRFEGALHSLPFSDFTIEFFASPACDASGFGQGEEFLGTTSVLTNGAGDASFDVLLNATVPEGWVATTTATREPVGATSEFSACTLVTGTSAPGTAVCFGDGTGTPCPCGNTSTSGRGCGTTAGDGMYVTGTGSTSIGADDLTLTAHDVPVGNTGIFYAGQTALAGNPLYDGLQCAGGSTFRFSGRLATTSAVTQTGFVGEDAFGLFWVPGTTYTFQYFTRDNQAGPSPCGGLANLSAAYAVTMTP